ncbi:MAG: Xaa-Pro peptidase family protein [Treponema sp.]|jgi:Xaa-Pro dipeptidase|nr:Xaa-Pro peptidase family protein [Treponema sp.]
MNYTYYSERTQKIRTAMTALGIDLLLISPSSNLFYLTGYALNPDERLFLLVLPKEGEPFIIANILYKEQVKPLPVTNHIFWKDGDNPFLLLKAEIDEQNIKIKTAALEPQIPALFSLPLSQTFPQTNFVLASSFIDPIRQIKDKSELDMIRRACKTSDQALKALINKGAYWIGKTEAEFFMELSAEFSKRGLSSFGASVQTGVNAAIPHYITGNGIIEKGKCLLVDFWGRYNGYYTDCTRTFYFGTPDSEFKKIYEIVKEAQEAAEAKAHVGYTLEDVDLAARSVIEKHGYGEYFTHRTGHGLGIDVHEGDSVNKGVKVPLKPGMVFSIEPGIYLPGRFGVRIENIVAITEQGVEVLHNFTKELITF